MRPLRLSLEGFTSFRHRTELDLEGLDLFAVTGPTGVGKSSLIDALVFALYGQVPRVGKEFRQLINQNAGRLAVRLDFAVGERRYRVARVAKPSGATQVRLEQLQGDGTLPLADRVREVDGQIQAIVGLDYDAFTRAVVLPQGEFASFLKGRPEERRAILVALLRLGVYEQVHTIVNRRAADARREAGFIAGQLAADYGAATQAGLEAVRAELRNAEQERIEVEARLDVLDGLVAPAQKLKAARRELASLEREWEAEQARLARSETALGESEGRGRDLTRKLAEAQARAGGAGFDEKRLLGLLDGRPRAEQLDGLRSTQMRLETERPDQVRDVEQAEQALAEAARAVAEGEATSLSASQALSSTRARREEARSRHAAHDLRRGLVLGEVCPVCEQVVRRLPGTEALAVDEGARDLDKAEAALRQAQRELSDRLVAAERRGGELHAARTRLADLETRLGETSASVREIQAVLWDAGFGPLETADPADLLSRIRSALAELEKARRRQERLQSEVKTLEAEQAALDRDRTRARAQLEAGSEGLARVVVRRAATRGAVEQTERRLLELSQREPWLTLETASGQEEAEAIEAQRDALRRRSTELAGVQERRRAELERLQRDVARAAELQEKQRSLEGEAALAGSLAQHLQANQFLAYVQEEALSRLAEDGSSHLLRLSQGRYSLVCQAQEFFVVDHWSADTQRSVKTLSGGESFLASLSLALALAEGLSALSAGGRAGEALESLFLDEGFGTLDPETLDQVVQAIESLRGGTRMVGIVTHIQELAERLPARVEVSRTAAGATVRVV